MEWNGQEPAPVRAVEGADADPDRADLLELKNACLTRAQRAYPQLAVTPERFMGQLTAVLQGVPDPEAALASVHAEDLYLACGCAEGLPGALAGFESLCAATIIAYLPAAQRGSGDAEEVRQLLRQQLFVGTAATPPRIARYSGRAPLACWAGVVARRLALSLRRHDQSHKRRNQEMLMNALSGPADPELGHMKDQFRPYFEAAIQEAMAGLSPRDRALLKMQIVGGMNMETLGALHGVNASTVCRWLAAARTVVRKETLRLLRGRLSLEPAEIESIMKLAPSDIDLTISRLLA